MRAIALLASLTLVQAAHGQQSAGATDWYGRGMVGIENGGTLVKLNLTQPAQGFLLRFLENQPTTIVATGPFAAGESTVRIPPQERAERVSVANVQGTRTGADQAAGAVSCRSGGATTTMNGQATGAGVCVSTQRADWQPGQGRGTTILRAPPREYLLLVLSDVPPDTGVMRRIGVIPGFNPDSAAHDVTEFLVGRVSAMWAGYLVRR